MGIAVVPHTNRLVSGRVGIEIFPDTLHFFEMRKGNGVDVTTIARIRRFFRLFRLFRFFLFGVRDAALVVITAGTEIWIFMQSALVLY